MSMTEVLKEVVVECPVRLTMDELLERGDSLAQAKLDWVIVGGESGPGARPCHEAWVRSIVQQCQAAGTPVFVKQLGAFPIWSLSDGRPANGEGGTAKAARTVAGALNPKCADPSEWPEDLRVREFPR